MKIKLFYFWTAILLMTAVPAKGLLKIIIIGDSTVQDFHEAYAPMKGWGQMIPYFFDSTKVIVQNEAAGGNSTKTFLLNYWPAIQPQIQTGDYLFIQFGINDMNYVDFKRYVPEDEFKENLTIFVNQAREYGAIPILVSTARSSTWSNGKPADSYGEYPQITRNVAEELAVPLVDLDKFCYDLFSEQGNIYAQRFCTMSLEQGEYSNYPEGISDNTHYQEIGAIENARFVVETIEKSDNEDLKKLATCTLPRHKVTFWVNDSTKSKAISRTADFPEGINVTLKAIPQDDTYFHRWEDDAHNVISTSPIYTIKMGASDLTFKAIYGTENGIEETAQDHRTLLYPNPTKGETHLMLYAEQNHKATLVISDLLGNTLRKEEVRLEIGLNDIEIDCGTLEVGNYTIQVDGQIFRMIKQ